MNFQFNNQQNSKVIDIDKEKMKKIYKLVGFIIGGFILLLIFINSFLFTVGQREQVVVTQLDKIVRVIVDDLNDPAIKETMQNPRYKDIKFSDRKGLHIKIPIIQSTRSFSNKLLTYDTPSNEVYTIDKKAIVLDNYAQWKIHNPVLFMQNIGTASSAHQRIDDIIFSKLREDIGKVDAHTLISDREYGVNLLNQVKDYTNEQLVSTGIVVVDVKIRRTEYPEAIYQNIYDQMISERQAIATQYRSEGQREAITEKSLAEREATIIEAKAYEEAQKLKGEGDAEALKIYAEAYNKDPEFYAFWQTLQTYKHIIEDDTTIIINPSSDLAKYLFGK